MSLVTFQANQDSYQEETALIYSLKYIYNTHHHKWSTQNMQQEPILLLTLILRVQSANEQSYSQAGVSSTFVY